MLEWVTHCALVTHQYTMLLFGAGPCSTVRFLFHCQYLCGTILPSLYLMVWDWQVSRVGPIPFTWHSCSLLLVSLSLLSFYGLVLWGWDLQNDRVSITLFQLCISHFFLNNNILLHFDGCCAIPRCQSCSSRVPDL